MPSLVRIQRGSHVKVGDDDAHRVRDAFFHLDIEEGVLRTITSRTRVRRTIVEERTVTIA